MSKAKTKNKKIIKITKKNILFSSIAVILILLVAIQIMFNKFVWDSLKQKEAFNLRHMIVEAIRSTQQNSLAVNENGEIKEARLKLPVDTKINFKNIRYTHYPKDDNNEWPENIQISTDKLFYLATANIPFPNNGDFVELFKKIPEAQACTRGYEIRLDSNAIDTENTNLILEKQLSDGRKIQIFRESVCGKSENNSNTGSNPEIKQEMDKLQAILIDINSL